MTNKLSFFIISIVLLSCDVKSDKKDIEHNEQEAISISKSNNCDLKKKFNKYRDFINQKNVSEVTKALDLSESSNIWQVISFNKQQEEILNQSLLDKPLKQSDIMENFGMIFPKEFVKCFNMLSIDELFNNGEFTTGNYKINEVEGCKIISFYESDKKKIDIILVYEFYEDGDKFESSVNYSYKLDNCIFKMIAINMAG